MSDFRTGIAWDGARAYVLKLRHTGSRNVGGGEGAMPATEVACTLACGQDMTIFQRKPVYSMESTQANAQIDRERERESRYFDCAML